MKAHVTLSILFISLSLLAQTPGDNLYNPKAAHEIKIILYKNADWDTIKVNYKFGNEQLTYVPVKMEIDNIVYDSVGLAIKGNTYINEDTSFIQYPFKVDLNEFKDGQKHDKIKKFNLNTKELDNNIVMNNLFAAFQVPYLRTARTKVYIKGIDAGDYLLVEQVDNTYLKRIFLNNDGNLFKGDNQADLQWMGSNQADYELKYSLKNNETLNDYSDLIKFIETLNITLKDSSFLDSLKNQFDFSSYMKILSLQVLMGKHDDYFDKNHNYYLYHNPVNGKFSFIPYDNDDVKSAHHQLFIDEGRLSSLPLIQVIKNNNELRNQYFTTICSVMANLKEEIPPIGTKYNKDYSAYVTYAEESINLTGSEISQSGFDCTSTLVKNIDNQTKLWFWNNKLYLKNTIKTGKIEIKSLLGQSLYQTKTKFENDLIIDLSFLNPAVYIVNYTAKNKVQTIKILVK